SAAPTRMRAPAAGILGRDLRNGGGLRQGVDQDLSGDVRAGILGEEAEGKAREQPGIRTLNHAAAGIDAFHYELAPLPRFQGIDPQRTRKTLVKEEESLRRGLQPVFERQPQKRGARG